MKSGRLFVTVVVLLGMAAATACNRDNGPRRQAAQAETDRKAALVKEGNDKIKQMETLQADLKANHKIAIPADKDATTFATADKFDWSAHRAELRDIQGKLAQLLQVTNRILEIDAQRKVVEVKNRDVIVLNSQTAQNFQRSLEAFAAKNGGI